jgi:hypothetical protein
MTKGLTIWLVFGPWGNPSIRFGGEATIFRICLGWVSFAIVKIDVEWTLSNLLLDEKDK